MSNYGSLQINSDPCLIDNLMVYIQNTDYRDYWLHCKKFNVPHYLQNFLKHDFEDAFLLNPIEYFYLPEVQKHVLEIIKDWETRLKNYKPHDSEVVNHAESIHFLHKSKYDIVGFVQVIQNKINAQKQLLQYYRTQGTVCQNSYVVTTDQSMNSEENSMSKFEYLDMLAKAVNDSIHAFRYSNNPSGKAGKRKIEEPISISLSSIDVNLREMLTAKLSDIIDKLKTLDCYLQDFIGEVCNDLRYENILQLHCSHQLGFGNFDLWVTTMSNDLEGMYKTLYKNLQTSILKDFIHGQTSTLKSEFTENFRDISLIIDTIHIKLEDLKKQLRPLCLIVSHQDDQNINVKKQFKLTLTYLLPELLEQSTLTIKAYLQDAKSMEQFCTSNDAAKLNPPSISALSMLTKVEFGMLKDKSCQLTVKLKKNLASETKQNKTKKTDQELSEKVVDKKIVILFHGSIDLTSNSSRYDAQPLSAIASFKKRHNDSACSIPIYTWSIPVVKTTHPNQYIGANATLFWYNVSKKLMSPQTGVFSVLEFIHWDQLSYYLSVYLGRCNHNSPQYVLTPGNISYLKQKISPPEDGLITFKMFAHDKLNARDHKFSDWIFGVVKVILDNPQVKTLVKNKQIIGFHTTEDIKKMFMDCPGMRRKGAFVLRFSDTDLSGITATYLAPCNNNTFQVCNHGPFLQNDLSFMNLLEWLKCYDVLKFLWDGSQLIPKEEICKDLSTEKCRSGYQKKFDFKIPTIDDMDNIFNIFVDYNDEDPSNRLEMSEADVATLVYELEQATMQGENLKTSLSNIASPLSPYSPSSMGSLPSPSSSSSSSYFHQYKVT